MLTVPTSLRRTRGRHESVNMRRNASRVFGLEIWGKAEEISLLSSSSVISFLHN